MRKRKNFKRTLAALLSVIMLLSSTYFPVSAADEDEITLGFAIQNADNGKNGWAVNPGTNLNELAVDLIMTGSGDEIDFLTAQLYIQYDPEILDFDFTNGFESKIIASQSRSGPVYLSVTASNPKAGMIQLTYTPFSASEQNPNAKIKSGEAFTTLYFNLTNPDTTETSADLSYQLPTGVTGADMMVVHNVLTSENPETRYDLRYTPVTVFMPDATPSTPTPTPEATNTPTPTSAPETTNTPTPTAAPGTTNTPTPTAAPETTNTPTPTPAPDVTSTPTPLPALDDETVRLGFAIQNADNGKNGWAVNSDTNLNELAVDLIMTGSGDEIDFLTAQLYIQYDPAVLTFDFENGFESKIIASQSRNGPVYLSVTASAPKAGMIQLTYTPFSASEQNPNAKIKSGEAFTTLYFNLTDENTSANNTNLSYQLPTGVTGADMMVVHNVLTSENPETRYNLQYTPVTVYMPNASASTPTPTPETTGAPTPETTNTPTPETTGTPAPEVTNTPTPETTGTPAPGVTNTPTPRTTPTSTPTPEATPTPDPENTVKLSFAVRDADNGNFGWNLNPNTKENELTADLIMTGNGDEIDFLTAQLYIQYDPEILAFDFTNGFESKIIASQSRNGPNYLNVTANAPKSGIIQLTYTPFSASEQTPNAKIKSGEAFTTLYFTLRNQDSDSDSETESTDLAYRLPDYVVGADMMVVHNVLENENPETRYYLEYEPVTVYLPKMSDPTPTPTPETTNTPTPTPEVTNAPEVTDTPTPTPTNAPEVTDTPTPTPTNAPEVTDTPTPTPTNAPEVTNTPTPAPEITNTPTPTPTPAPGTTNTPTPTPTNTPTPTPTNTPTPTPVVTNTPTPTPYTPVASAVLLNRQDTSENPLAVSLSANATQVTALVLDQENIPYLNAVSWRVERVGAVNAYPVTVSASSGGQAVVSIPATAEPGDYFVFAGSAENAPNARLKIIRFPSSLTTAGESNLTQPTDDSLKSISYNANSTKADNLNAYLAAITDQLYQDLTDEEKENKINIEFVLNISPEKYQAASDTQSARLEADLTLKAAIKITDADGQVTDKGEREIHENLDAPVTVSMQIPADFTPKSVLHYANENAKTNGLILEKLPVTVTGTGANRVATWSQQSFSPVVLTADTAPDTVYINYPSLNSVRAYGASDIGSSLGGNWSLTLDNAASPFVSGVSVLRKADFDYILNNAANKTANASVYQYSGGGGGGGGSSRSSSSTRYDITIASGISGGTVKSSVDTARSGAYITLTVTPNTGYKIDDVSVTRSSDNNTSVKVSGPNRSGDYNFTMPAYDVTVNARFVNENGEAAPTPVPTSSITPPAGQYAVQIASNITNGTIHLNSSSAAPGATVPVQGVPNTGYGLFNISVTDANGNAIAAVQSDTGATFTMPSSNVTVNASFLPNPFSDINAGHHYYKPVLWALNREITKGKNETVFAPYDACTRGQMVAFLWRAAGSPTPTTQNNPFTDVLTSKYYYNAVLWAVEHNITQGTSATTFAPDMVVTRGQMVTFLHRMDNAGAVQANNPFTDVVNPASYFYYPVLWAIQNGITNGITATTFEPMTGCTRGQIATFLYRFFNR